MKRRRPPPVGETERRFRACVAYDGTPYAGWQRQPADVSVQEMIEAALDVATGLRTSISGAGRTDAGVHAEGQVFAFATRSELPAEALLHLCRRLLPPDIRVIHLEPAPEPFRPRRARRKLYRYTVLEAPTDCPARERVAWRLAEPLDREALRGAAAHLVGRHDFRAFRNDPGAARRDEDTVRLIERLDVRRLDDLLLLDVQGPGFLYMMVRNVVAALVEVGSGRRPAGWVSEVLEARDRSRLPPPAPARGLCLVKVEYDDGFGG